MERMNTPALPRLRLLLVEDDATQRELLKTFLEHLGQEVLCAENGEAAVHAFAESAPDLVLMDILLPGMDGFEATSRIQTLAEGRWVPVIYLTAMQQRASVLAGLAAGGHDYLVKPVDLDLLEAKLHPMLRAIETHNTLLAAEALLGMVFDPCEHAAIGFGDDGAILACNAGAASLLGYSPEALRRQAFPALLASAGAPKTAAEFVTLAGGEAVPVTVRRGDGRQMPVALRIRTREVKSRPVFLALLGTAGKDC
jgi:CheY-like chemotaxis protein